MTERDLPTLGFIGTGTINSALVRAFCRSDGPAHPIVVSPRSAERAAALKQEFPSRVRVAASMQEVADAADCIFVAVLPKAVEEVYRSLHIDDTKHIIDLIPNVTEDQIRDWTGFKGEISHIIPLSFVADLRGPVVLYPSRSSIRSLLEEISDPVLLDDRLQVAAAQVLTCFQAPYFTLLEALVDWAEEQGFDPETATSCVTGIFKAQSEQVNGVSREHLHELAGEFTPGGYNWRSREHIGENGGYVLWTDSARQLMELLTSVLGK